jgi:aspartyl-tRNA(Asn)/glutamyl-tRNA(Gln) amidotransferase subunit A
MAELSRPDPRDATSLPPQAIAWDRLDDLDLRGLRLGLLVDAGWGLTPEPRQVDIVTAAARAFEAAGCIVEPLAPFTTHEMADCIDLFWRMRSWLDLQALPPERRERVLPFIRAWAGRGAGYSAAQVFHGHAQMAVLRDAAVAACARFDFVLSPVAPVPAFPALHASPTNDPAQAMAHIGFTLPFNMSEQPAIAVPAGMTADGLPVGLQIAGRRHDDLGVLRLARAWERLRPPLPAGPPI